MQEHVQLLETRKVRPNPENPRLVFHQEELDALQDSIRQQGILVPLTVYREDKKFRIIDGERRWRCSIKLGLKTVPAIIQPKPDRLQNLMMMFAIHHRRNEWDPLPTALKLRTLDQLYVKRHRKQPTEKQLAELASLTRGEVRRYKKLLALPVSYRNLLMAEIKKPRAEQTLTVDHVLEATAAASALKKRKIIHGDDEDRVRRSIVNKYISGVIKNTVEPRRFARLARAVERKEVTRQQAEKVVNKFVSDKNYSIQEMFTNTVEEVDFQHSVDLMAERITTKLEVAIKRKYEISDSLRKRLTQLNNVIGRLLRD